MTKEELIAKWGKETLSEVVFWEEVETSQPFFYKAKQIAEGAKIDLKDAEDALRDYQCYKEV